MPISSENEKPITQYRTQELAEERGQGVRQLRMNSEDERTIRRYLLQELNEEERQRVEERMMTDDAFFEEVTFAEDELAAEYASGALTGVELQEFEQSFLTTPEGRQDVNFNKAFRAHLPPPPLPKPQSFASIIALLWRSYRPAAAFALGVMLVLVALNASLLITERRRRAEIARLQANMEKLQQQLADERDRASQAQADSEAARQLSTSLEQQLADLKENIHIIESGPSVTYVLSVLLSPGHTRGSPAQPVRIFPYNRTVELNLRIPSGEYATYSAEVIRKDGELISRSATKVKRMKSETRAILRLPASKLPPGDYEIKLAGKTAEGKIEPIDSYYFTVEKSE